MIQEYLLHGILFRHVSSLQTPPEILILTAKRRIEGAAWYNIPEFNLLAKNITVPGLSPIYPDVHCTADEEVCQIVTGESGMLKVRKCCRITPD